MTKNTTPTPVYLDPGMHPGLEVKGLRFYLLFYIFVKGGHSGSDIVCLNYGLLTVILYIVVIYCILSVRSKK